MPLPVSPGIGGPLRPVISPQNFGGPYIDFRGKRIPLMR